MLKRIFIISTLALLAFGRPQAQAPASGAGTSGNAAPAPTAAASAGSNSNASASITSVKDERQPLDDKGSYRYDIELSDGTKLQQEGNTEAPGAGENETSIVIKGSYSYIAPDGTPVSVMYIANKDGFQPVGDVIPKSNATAPAAAPAAGAGPGAATASAGSPPAASDGSAAPAPTASAPQTAAAAATNPTA